MSNTPKPLWGLTTAASILTGNRISEGKPDTAAVCYLLMGLGLWRRFESGKWKRVEIIK